MSLPVARKCDRCKRRGAFRAIYSYSTIIEIFYPYPGFMIALPVVSTVVLYRHIMMYLLVPI